MASDSPLVSVCVPTYNGELYLRECLDSILAQTTDDFELLLVDDCSKDRTRELSASYAAKDSRVRLVPNQANLGLVGNWNRCIELARGEWIKFVFQDDTIAPTCLARMLDVAEPADVFIACQRDFIFDANTPEFIERWYRAHRGLLRELYAGSSRVSPERCQTLALECFGLNVFGEPTAVMMRRSIFEKVGLFNPAVVINCDFEMWARITVNYGAVFIPDDLAKFRVHGGSATANLHEHRKFRATVLDNLVILHQYVYDPLFEPVRQAALRSNPPIDLAGVFDWESHDARWQAEWSNRKHADHDPRLLAQWNDVVAAYPRIAPSGVSHFLWRLRQRFFPRTPPVLTPNARRVPV